MNLLTARNAHEMLPVVLDRLFKLGVPRESRNGSVLQLPGPTLLCYEHPEERVIFWPERDANPFFHLFESMWMLAGQQDVASLTRYVSRMSQFSDDGINFHGAYGFRWRIYFGVDQLTEIINNLKGDPTDRRQVLTMWSPFGDLRHQVGKKDLPCNTHAYFAINHEGRLDMTLCNRSNDLVWGALGANIVHFTFLQEWMAEMIGVPMGSFYQFTNNLHGYLATLHPLRDLVRQQGSQSPYSLGEISPTRLGFTHVHQFVEYVGGFIPSGHPFLRNVCGVADEAYFGRKTNGTQWAIERASTIAASDWRKACTEWLKRRLARAQDDGVTYEH